MEALKIVIMALSTSIALIALIRQWLSDRPFAKMPTDKLKLIASQWKGVVHQPEGPDGIAIEMPIKLNLKKNFKKIVGTGSFEYKGKSYKLRLKGRPMHSNYFVLTYFEDDPGVFRYGTFIIQISSDSSLLQGKFIAFAPEMERAVTGAITLKNLAR